MKWNRRRRKQPLFLRKSKGTAQKMIVTRAYGSIFDRSAGDDDARSRVRRPQAVFEWIKRYHRHAAPVRLEDQAVYRRRRQGADPRHGQAVVDRGLYHQSVALEK